METIYDSSRSALPKSSRPAVNPKMLVFLLTAVLLTIPLNYGFSSAAVIMLVVYTLITARREDFSFNASLALPVALFVLMTISLLWSVDFKSTLKALSKEISLLIIPVIFCFNKLWQKQVNDVLKFFSFGMLCYGLFYIVRAFINYVSTGNINSFFYHDLVTKDLNAIYVSVFLSVAFFYYLEKKQKRRFEYIALAFLFTLIFLLSSKNILVADGLLIILYFLFYSGINLRARLAAAIVFCVLITVVGFNSRISERIAEEFTPSGSVAPPYGVRNISIYEAWNMERFEQNDYFNGTALRAYQIRIFTEMLNEDPILFKGYGLNASRLKVMEKGEEHNIFKGSKDEPGYNTYNFHNQYIEVFADLGIIGLAIVVLMMVFNLKNGISRKDFIHIAFAILMIALFLTESFLWRQRGVIFFIVFYCLFNKDLYSGALEKEKK